ncbi:MFS transporter [Mucilaginibacter terrae]|uniref:MFS family arabinose efflux permease n=1 Tax=Mucilaginibacter terrae TaxID=1955052 RepID=A0ABU3H0F4_9SPHI|nr:MFS transporter [Mucilaginibacter terrae]MDT3405495.1 putative MFS family arabinose efflux permease [Mucilaginibacter terrae]
MFNYTINLYKAAYSGLARSSWYLSLVLLVNRSGTMVLPFMTIYCTQHLHFTIAQAGIVMSMFGLGSLAGAFLGGKITDKYGFYDVQFGALLSGGLIFLILGFQQSLWSVCLTSFILSVCNDAFRPANSTAVAHYSTPETRTRSYSLNRLAVNLGWAVGGAVGGFIASVNYHLLFWVDGFTNIFSAFLLLKLMPRTGAVKKVLHKAQQAAVTASAYKDGVYLLFLVFTALFATCFFQFFTLQPVFFKTHWHYTERFIGMLMSINGLLIIAIEMVLVHKIDGRRHPLVYIPLGVLLMGFGFALTNLLPGTGFTGFMIIVFLTIGEIMSMPFMNAFWISRANESNTGQYAGLYSMAWSTAQIAAPALGSFLVDYNGYTFLWWALGVISIVSAGGFTVLYYNRFSRRTKPLQVNI